LDADLVILGGGPAGYSAALRAAQLGARPVLIERARVGGTCLHLGCIPAKTLLAAAELRVRAAGMEGLGLSVAAPDVAALNRRKRGVVEALASQLQSLLAASCVNVVPGEGELVEPGVVRVRRVDGGEETFRGGKVIVATGSEPRSLPGVVRVPGRVMNSNDLITADSWPDSLIIVGGGVIGAEFASLFAILGVKVVLLEALPRLLMGEDSDLGKRMMRALTRNGIEVRVGEKMESLAEESVGVRVRTVSGGDFRAAAALLCVGRSPCLSGVDAGALGLESVMGAIRVDAEMRTSLQGVFAAGDVTGGPQLAHLAAAQGRKAASSALGVEDLVDLSTVPRCVYSIPEAAAVGLGEERVRERNIKYRKAVVLWRGVSRAQCINETEGMTKVIAEEGTGRILGAHIFGHCASELISEACLAIRLNLTVKAVSDTMHPHPALSESFAQACAQLAR